MAQGTRNEEPTIQKFASIDYAVEFYEVGLLQMKDHPTIGVSPDGIAWVIISGDEFEENGQTLVYVQIKTRLVDSLLLTDFRFNTFKRCESDDEIFKKCVPSQNHKQFIQQSTVTGLSWGVLITAKVKDGHGSIVQTVFVHFSDQQKDEYLKSLLILTVPLLD